MNDHRPMKDPKASPKNKKEKATGFFKGSSELPTVLEKKHWHEFLHFLLYTYCLFKSLTLLEGLGQTTEF